MSNEEQGTGTDLMERPDVKPGSVEYYDAVREAALLPAHDYPDGHIRTIMKMSVPKKASFADACGYLSICRQYGLNPILGQVFLIITDDGPKVVTGRDTYITVAERRPTFKGIVTGIVLEGESCVIRRDPDDPYKVYVDHDQGFTGEVIGWYCIVFDSERPPLIFRRMLNDYAYLFGKRNWKQDKKGMGENRCIAGALKRMYSLAGLLMEGEEMDIGAAGGGDPTGVGAKAQTEAEKLADAIGKTEAANGIHVEEDWTPEVVITEGVHKGERWMDVATEAPKYMRQVANRKWLGTTAKDAEAMHAYLDSLEAPEEPQTDDDPPEVPEAQEEPEAEETATAGELDQLHKDTLEIATELAKRSLLTSEESDEIGILKHEGNLVGLRDLKEELERKLKGGEVESTDGPQGGLWHE
ncbi:hypothetical protein LCGC14_1526150 [marine sediment metagenome]|uniref:Phage recombination protein Bet n=1 Tax=marine sediment metagenome TaxID=412755 RepID=A0A0F9JI35_9ZZZZ